MRINLRNPRTRWLLVALITALLLIAACEKPASASGVGTGATNDRLHSLARQVWNVTCDGIDQTRYNNRCRATEDDLARMSAAADANPQRVAYYWSRQRRDARTVYRKICGAFSAPYDRCQTLRAAAY